MRGLGKLGICLCVVFAVASLSHLAMGEDWQAWYSAIRKPAWTPPGAAFTPVWAALYAMMAVAAWLVWERAGSLRAAALPLGVFLVQLVLNGLWMPIFFGMHNPGLALAEAFVLWSAVLIMCVEFGRVSRPAAWLLAPYFAWITFAAVLNTAIWRMNA